MVAEARGRIWRRKDGKYFMYLPKHLVEDSAFPFKTKPSIPVKVIIDPKGKKLLIKPLAHKQQTWLRSGRDTPFLHALHHTQKRGNSDRRITNQNPRNIPV